MEHKILLKPGAQHAEDAGTTMEVELSNEPYGPVGFKGLLASRYVALCACFSAIGGLLFGYDQGVIAVILVMPEFLDRFPQVAETAPGAGFYKGLMTAMITLGAFVGAICQGWVADAYSRKYAIVIAVVVFTVGSSLQTAAANYDMLVASRFIGGAGIGMLSMVAPLYIAEISPPEIRGTLLILQEFSIVLGIVVAFFITYGTQYWSGTEWSWRLPFLIQIFPGLFLGIGAVFLPFSPRWLASKGRNDEALASLAKLRTLDASDARVKHEWFQIMAEAAFQEDATAQRHPDLVKDGHVKKFRLEIASWVDCFRSGCWRRTLVGMGLMFFQQFVGINALIYYSPTLFGTMGLDHSMQLIMSGVLNVTQLFGVVTGFWSMDRFGRRPVLLYGAIVMAISHIVIAALVGSFSSNWPAHAAGAWASVAFLFIYMLGFGASWGPVPWAMPSEIFPSSLRAKGVALSTCSNWICNFIIGLITPPLIQATGFGAYIFFAVFCALAFVWTYFFVPETNGKALEDMDKIFHDHSSNKEIAYKEEILRIIIQRQASAVVV